MVTVLCGEVWLLYCVVRYGYCIVWYGMVWYGMVWYGMVWYCIVWYGMVWYSMVWYGMWYAKLYGIMCDVGDIQLYGVMI